MVGEYWRPTPIWVTFAELTQIYFFQFGSISEIERNFLSP